MTKNRKKLDENFGLWLAIILLVTGIIIGFMSGQFTDEGGTETGAQSEVCETPA